MDDYLDFLDDCDRTYTNEDDGMSFYGFDDDDGHTTWYTESGDLDCVTDTPKD